MPVFKDKKWWPGIALVIFSLVAGCSAPEKAPLAEIAERIRSAMAKTDQQILTLKDEAGMLLEKARGKQPFIQGNHRYKRYKERVLYTPEDDGRCEVWASGKVPVDRALIRKIRALEDICPLLSGTYFKSDLYSAVYLTLSESVLFCFPYGNANIYLTPGLDITEAWVTFREVDPGHNPEKKTVVTQPYLDALGRGHMVSVIAPVYTDKGFAGAVGIDMTTTALVNRFLSIDNRLMMIVSDKNNIVAVNKGCAALLNISGPGKHRYLDRASENRPLDEKFNLESSAKKGLRDIGHGLASGQNGFDLILDQQRYRALRMRISRPGWHLVELIPER